MFTSATGQKKAFYLPPANCLISRCRWRAGLYCRGRAKAQVGTGACTLLLHLSQTSQWLRASFSLRSFVETPSSDIWRCLSAVFTRVGFFSPLRHFKLLLTHLQSLLWFVLQLIRTGHDADVCIFTVPETILDHIAVTAQTLPLCLVLTVVVSVWNFSLVRLHTSFSSHTDPSSYSSRWWTLKVCVWMLPWEKWHIFDVQLRPSSLNAVERGRSSGCGTQCSAGHCGIFSERP